MTDKIRRKTCLKELRTALNQRGYATALINKGSKLAGKVPQKELRNPEKHNNEKHLAYVVTYTKNHPELFTKIK